MALTLWIIVTGLVAAASFFMGSAFTIALDIIRRNPEGKRRLRYRLIRSESMPGILTFALLLPEADSSVARRKLIVTVRGEPVFDSEIDPSLSELELPAFRGQHGDVVETRLVDYDEAGNASPVSIGNFVLQDIVPPKQPGEMKLKITGEIPSASTGIRGTGEIIPPAIVAEEKGVEHEAHAVIAAEAALEEVAPELTADPNDPDNVTEAEVEEIDSAEADPSEDSTDSQNSDDEEHSQIS